MNRSEFLKICAAGTAGWAMAPVGSFLAEGSNPATLGDTYMVKPTVVHSGYGFGNRVALTYDDGPTPGVTDRILTQLAKYDMRATFFVIGNKVRAYKSLARDLVAAGHEIANHTYTHPNLAKLSATRVQDEIRKCQDTIIDVTGKVPIWFRPPYGSFKKTQNPIPQKKDLGIAYWSVDTRDWAKPGVNKIVGTIKKNTKPGSIILLHDLHSQTADANPGLVKWLHENDYQCVRMTGFLGVPKEMHIPLS